MVSLWVAPPGQLTQDELSAWAVLAVVHRRASANGINDAASAPSMPRTSKGCARALGATGWQLVAALGLTVRPGRLPCCRA